MQRQKEKGQEESESGKHQLCDTVKAGSGESCLQWLHVFGIDYRDPYDPCGCPSEVGLQG
jgi:hypothetical protein